MDLSLCLDPGRPWPDLLDLATAAEEAGVHALNVPDHFLPHGPDDAVADGPVPECWTVLSAIAARTARARIGSLVLGGTYRHPAVVANMAATLDHVSGGRAILGLGAAWQVNEHRAYGLELPAVPDRLDRFEESTRVTASLLRHPRTTFSGRFFRLEDSLPTRARAGAPPDPRRWRG